MKKPFILFHTHKTQDHQRHVYLMVGYFLSIYFGWVFRKAHRYNQRRRPHFRLLRPRILVCSRASADRLGHEIITEIIAEEKAANQ